MMKSKKLLFPALSAVATATLAAPLILTLSSCGTKWDGDDVIKRYTPNFKPLQPEYIQQKINLIEGNDLWVDAYKHNHAIPNEEYKWSQSHISGMINLICDLLEAEFEYKPITLSRYNAKLYDFKINSEKDGVRRVSYRAVGDIILDFNFKMESKTNLEIENIHGSVRLAWCHVVNNMPFGLFDIGTDDIELFTSLLGLDADPLPEETLWFFGPDMSRVANNDNTWSLDFDFLTEGGIYLNDDKLIDLDNESKFKLDMYSSYTLESIISALIASGELPAKLGLAVSWQLERLIPLLAGWSSYYLHLINHYYHINSHQDDEETTYGWKTRTTKDDSGFVWADTSWSNPATIRYELGEKNIYLTGDGDVDLESGEIPDVFCLPIFVASDSAGSGFGLPNISIPQEVIATSYVSNSGDTLSVVFDWNPNYFADQLDKRPENGFNFSQEWRSGEGEDEPVNLQALMGDFTMEKVEQAFGPGALVPLIFTKDWVAIGRPFDLCETKNIRFDEIVDDSGDIVPINRFEATEQDSRYEGNIVLQMDKDAFELFNEYKYNQENLPVEMNLVQIESQEQASMTIDEDKNWSVEQEFDDYGEPTGKYFLTIPFYSDNLGTYGETDPYKLQFKYDSPIGDEAYCVVGTSENPVIGYSSVTPEEPKNEWDPEKSKTILLSADGSTTINDAFEFITQPTSFSIESGGMGLPDGIININVTPGTGSKYNVEFSVDETLWPAILGYQNCTIRAYDDDWTELASFSGFNFVNEDQEPDLSLSSGAITSDVTMSPAEAIDAATFVPDDITLPGNGQIINVALFDGDHNIVSYIRPVATVSANAGVEGQPGTLNSINISFNALQAAEYEDCVLVIAYRYIDGDGNQKIVYGHSDLEDKFNLTINAEAEYDAEWASDNQTALWPDKVITFNADGQTLTSSQQIRLVDSTLASLGEYNVELSSEDYAGLSEIVDVEVVNDEAEGYLKVVFTSNAGAMEILQDGPIENCVLELSWLDSSNLQHHAVISDLVFRAAE